MRSLSRRTTWRLCVLPGTKKDRSLIAGPFDMRAPAVTRLYRLLVERLRDGGAGFMQQTSRRGGQGDFARRPVLAGAFDSLDLAQVGVARRRGVVGLEEAKKRPGRRLRRARASQPSTVAPRRPSRTEGVRTAGSSRTERRVDRRRGMRGPSAGENRSRSLPRLPGSHAPPRDARRLATDFACPSERGSGADDARYDGRDTGWRRPRCSSGSPDRRARDPG